MPQMAPYNWFILFMMFNFVFMIITSHHHFMFSNPIKFKKQLFILKLNWKW